MNELRFEGLTRDELVDVNANFGPGAQIVLGAERDGTNTLLRLAAGSLEPRVGRALLNGVAPFTNARARRGIATLFSDEAPLPARDALGWVALALRARTDTRSPRRVLEAAGLASLATLRPSDLNPRQTRAIALAIALSHAQPRLVALHEPLALSGTIDAAFIVGSLQRLADAGAVVLLSASRLEDADRLPGTLHALDRGRWLPAPETRRALDGVTLRVRTPEARRLAARLAEAPDVSAVAWTGGQELLVRGQALAELAHSVVANARAEAIRISALTPDRPTLDALAGARSAATPGPGPGAGLATSTRAR